MCVCSWIDIIYMYWYWQTQSEIRKAKRRSLNAGTLCACAWIFVVRRVGSHLSNGYIGPKGGQVTDNFLKHMHVAYKSLISI